MALFEIMQQSLYKVEALLTVVNNDYDRVSHHGVRRTLLHRQSQSIGLSLEEVSLSARATNEEYEGKMREILTKYKAKGVNSVAFGDIFLEDLRKYRETRLAEVGMRGVFPLWHENSSDLVRKFLRLGFKTIIVCVDPKKLDPSFAGRMIDDSFLSELPQNVDPCGENGEFHSFVYDGPIFKELVRFKLGQVVQREGGNFFRDLIPT